MLGKDRDLGYSIMRVSADQTWHPVHLLQPVYNQALAMFFEWGVAFYDLEVDLVRDGKKSKEAFKRDLKRFWRKARRQLAKDFVLFPALSRCPGRSRWWPAWPRASSRTSCATSGRTR